MRRRSASTDIGKRLLISFACFGMVIFCVTAMYSLRTKKEESKEGDQYFDEGGDSDVRFIDGGGKSGTEDDDRPSKRIKALRDRADKRRTRIG